MLAIRRYRKSDSQVVGVLIVDNVARGVTVFKLLATMHAVPFYLAMGYRKSTACVPSTVSRGADCHPSR